MDQSRGYSNKLWTKEGRMFSERIIYLNKSTTKYVIIGVDPVSFVPTMTISDRCTGCHISITLNQFTSFTRAVSEVLNTPMIGDDVDHGHPACYIDFVLVGEGIWKLSSSYNRVNSILIQKISLLNFERIAYIIREELRLRDGGYKEEMDRIHKETENMNEIEILHFLEGQLREVRSSSLRYNLLIDLICNKDYLITLSEYNEGFFNRCVNTV